MAIKKSIIPVEKIEKSILLIRKQKVMLDADLAKLYGVSTKRLNEQVKRNKDRFPKDFMFQLSKEEFDNLRSQIATSNIKGGRRYLPYVFTEHGAIMLANIINNPEAVKASIQVVRAFVHLRKSAYANQLLLNKIEKLERKYESHDEQIQAIFEAIKQLMLPPKNKKRQPIGFN